MLRIQQTSVRSLLIENDPKFMENAKEAEELIAKLAEVALMANVASGFMPAGAVWQLNEQGIEFLIDELVAAEDEIQIPGNAHYVKQFLQLKKDIENIVQQVQNEP